MSIKIHKLDGIAERATNITVDSALSNTSENPVQNKVIYSQLQGKLGTDDRLATDNSIANAQSDQSGKLPTVQHVKDYVDTRVTSVSGMVKFDPSENTYKLEVSNNKIDMSFSATFVAKLKFVKIDNTFVKTSEVTSNLSITGGSLVQIGYVDGGKLAITEPVWLEIKNTVIGGSAIKEVDVTHSI